MVLDGTVKWPTAAFILASRPHPTIRAIIQKAAMLPMG